MHQIHLKRNLIHYAVSSCFSMFQPRPTINSTSAIVSNFSSEINNTYIISVNSKWISFDEYQRLTMRLRYVYDAINAWNVSTSASEALLNDGLPSLLLHTTEAKTFSELTGANWNEINEIRSFFSMRFAKKKNTYMHIKSMEFQWHICA